MRIVLCADSPFVSEDGADVRRGRGQGSPARRPARRQECRGTDDITVMRFHWSVRLALDADVVVAVMRSASCWCGSNEMT